MKNFRSQASTNSMKKLILFLFRLCTLLAFPLILVIILYCLFFVRENLYTGEINKTLDIKSSIDNALSKQEQRLEFLTPIISPKWFLYTVRIQNEVKFAVVSDTAEPPYLEYHTLLTLITDKEIQVLYGENKKVASGIKRQEILDKFSGYIFSLKGNTEQVFGPNSEVKFQHSPSLGAAYFIVTLSGWSTLLIYFFTLIAWGGLIILAKPLFQFVYFGKRWWLKR